MNLVIKQPVILRIHTKPRDGRVHYCSRWLCLRPHRWLVLCDCGWVRGPYHDRIRAQHALHLSHLKGYPHRDDGTGDWQ